MKISIVIPNYNGKELLKKNLPKILACQSVDEVIIVDDASTDGSVEEVKSQKSKVKNDKVKLKIIENGKNLGFASSVNNGVKKATGELVVLLNTDVNPEPEFLQEVIPHFDNPQVFAVGCLQKCKEGKQVVLRGRGIGRFNRGFLIHSRGETDRDDTLWVSGGAGIFRKTVWEKLGGMEMLYNPFYWEDIDLSYRALKAGFQLVFEAKSIVHHDQRQGAIRSAYSPFYIKTAAYRNQILFVWLNVTDSGYLFGHFLFLPFHLIKSLIAGDIAFISGFFLAIQLVPLVLVERRRNIKLSRLSDAQIL